MKYTPVANHARRPVREQLFVLMPTTHRIDKTLAQSPNYENLILIDRLALYLEAPVLLHRRCSSNP
jgi:adenosyl cobinamide kinase/adenosyl cobinamide phosphate guanylyltransferase